MTDSILKNLTRPPVFILLCLGSRSFLVCILIKLVGQNVRASFTDGKDLLAQGHLLSILSKEI